MSPREGTVGRLDSSPTSLRETARALAFSSDVLLRLLDEDRDASVRMGVKTCPEGKRLGAVKFGRFVAVLGNSMGVETSLFVPLSCTEWSELILRRWIARGLWGSRVS